MKKILIIVLCLCFIPIDICFAKNKISILEKEDYYAEVIEKQVKNALLKGKSKINLKSYKIKVNDYPELSFVTRYIPYLNKNIKATLYAKDGYYDELKITNVYSLSKTKSLISNIDKKINELTQIVNKKYTNENNALRLHDYIVSYYEYDESKNKDSYYLYGMLENKKGVCQSYAFLYKYILNKVDIKCYIVNSKVIDHAWNIVKIGNYYYHVDLCKDDPVKDNIGIVSHKYFLLSDYEIKKYGYKDRNRKELICNNKKYDLHYYKDINCPILINGNDRYYVKDRFLVLSDKNGNVKKSIDHVGYWSNGNQGYYLNEYSGLFIRNFCLYYNKSDGVYKYSFLNNKITCILKANKGKRIYGIRESKNLLEVNNKEKLNKNAVLLKINFLSL